jgi:hypothetical protein
MHPLDDQLSRLLNSAANPSPADAAPAAVLTQQMEDAVIRAWRSSRLRAVRGWFDGLLAPGLAFAGAAMALAVILNFQVIFDYPDTFQSADLERQIADSSTQLALLP